jgi:hypothetical protein
MRDRPEVPPAIAAEQEGAIAQELARGAIVVPSERPAKVQPVTAATSNTG